MIEYVPLYPLIVNPAGILHENVNFYGDPLLGRSKLADEKSHVFLVYRRVCPQICEAVSPEGSDVGEVSLIEAESFLR